ncbi:general stress protein [Carnobacterium pleistocenium]|uniref:general stress protein n=1 Tax=Carnobacterium pleistocenium TaxID=181073 RepID=UPI0006912551|nr:general stress protein [Carnobacterium pleistocenium]
MKRHVVGSYESPQEAVDAVKKLQGKGYQKDDITLVSSTESRNLISNTAATDVEVSTDEAVTDRTSKNDNTDDRSVWGKIKGSFSTSEHDDTVSTSSDDDPLYSYQKDIANGNIIVMVNRELKDIDESSSKTSENATNPLDTDPMSGKDITTNSQTTMEPTVPETSADLDNTKQN